MQVRFVRPFIPSESSDPRGLQARTIVKPLELFFSVTAVLLSIFTFLVALNTIIIITIKVYFIVVVIERSKMSVSVIQWSVVQHSTLLMYSSNVEDM